MSLRVLTRSLVLTLIVTLAACGAGDDSGSASDTSSVPVVPITPGGFAGSVALAPTVTTTTTPAITSSSGTLILENHYNNLTLGYIYLSPSADDDWGDDQLGGDVVSPGERWTLSQIPCPGSYDLRIADLSGREIVELNDVFLSCGQPQVIRLVP